MRIKVQIMVWIEVLGKRKAVTCSWESRQRPQQRTQFWLSFGLVADPSSPEFLYLGPFYSFIEPFIETWLDVARIVTLGLGSYHTLMAMRTDGLLFVYECGVSYEINESYTSIFLEALTPTKQEPFCSWNNKQSFTIFPHPLCLIFFIFLGVLLFLFQ